MTSITSAITVASSMAEIVITLLHLSHLFQIVALGNGNGKILDSISVHPDSVAVIVNTLYGALLKYAIVQVHL